MTKSQYADRKTVGTLALEAAKTLDTPVVGDMGHELMPALLEDLNNTIQSDPYDGEPFFIIIHEKKDLLLRNMILRRMVTTKKRPYPEDNLTVFWTNPKTQETRFCWSLPHKSTFVEYLLNPDRYPKEQIDDIKAYQANNLEHFGLKEVGKTDDGNRFICAIPNFKDRPLVKKDKLQFKM